MVYFLCGYLAVDSDTTLTNIKMDIAGYLFVQGSLYGSFAGANYIYVWGGQQVNSPNGVGFTTAGINVTGNVTLTGSAVLPDLFMLSAPGSAGANVYISGSLTESQMSFGSGMQSITGALANLTVKNGTASFSGSDTVMCNGNVYAGGNIAFMSNTGVVLNDVTSSSGTITITNDMTHTDRNVSAPGNITVTNVALYNAATLATNSVLTITGSTVNVTDTTDSMDETKSNIDISSGSGFYITNSTGNFQNSAVQTNGYLDINNTTWVSQNITSNGYTNMAYGTGTERVSVYFHGGADRTIYGSIFGGGGSIWVGTSATPDDGNIFMKRKAGVTTNGSLRVYRTYGTLTDSFATSPNLVPTPNTGLFTQLYDAALASNSGSVTILSGTTGNASNLIDGDVSSMYESAGALSSFQINFPRDMILAKVCVSTALHNTPENLKLQFTDNSGTILNTQDRKMPGTNMPRQCFDLNAYKARKVIFSGYGVRTSMGFGEVELWGVPDVTGNITTPLTNDIILQNGSYEIGGVVTAGTFTAASQTTKKTRVIQYHNNAPFNIKSTIALTSADLSGTTLTHSVGNELGLKFVTDTMNV